MPGRERFLSEATKYLIFVGTLLPALYLFPIILWEISSYFLRLSFLSWIVNLALLLSLPWELSATIVVIFRWRDLPQRFWITFCVNAYLAYTALPAYRVLLSLYG